MREEIIEVVGEIRGPTSIILAGVHGDEVCGVLALEKILPTLKIERGRVFFAYGNPQAIEKNKRFVEANLNRMFEDDSLPSELDRKSYEYKRAQYLKSYLRQADALLDIHASFTKSSKSFVICEGNAQEIVKYLPIDLVVSGFDKIEPGGTDYFMNSLGKMGICVECGYLGDSQSQQVAEESIFAFLKARGHLTGDRIMRKQAYARMYSLYRTRTDQFVLLKPFIDFEEVTKNQRIGTDGSEEVLAKRPGIILFARNREKIGEEAFLLGVKKNRLA